MKQQQLEDRIIQFENLVPLTDTPQIAAQNKARVRRKVTEENLIKMVCNKVEDRQISSAVRLLSDEHGLAPDNDETLRLLRDKHPRASHQSIDKCTMEHASYAFSTDAIVDAIKSFPQGSSGGIDAMTPQHLKELFLSPDECVDKSKNVEILTQFINFVISGGVPIEIRPIFFSPRLLALGKKDGGIRPIAVSSTIRRLASKLVVKAASKQLKDKQLN